MSGCCDDKVFEGMSEGYKRALLAVILINAVMFFVEITAGLKSGSQALLADALDFAGDARPTQLASWSLGPHCARAPWPHSSRAAAWLSSL